SVAAGKRPMMTRFMDECSQGVLAPGHILARRRLHQDLSVFHGELPPQPHLPDAAGGDEAFIGVVVHIGHAVLRSDHMAGAGVVDHDVRVAAGPQHALPGIETIQPGGILAEHPAHLGGADLPLGHAVGVQQL
ncbi:Replication initiator A N-terminal domain-containing protein, partial [Dysosmobacter welbionis]